MVVRKRAGKHDPKESLRKDKGVPAPDPYEDVDVGTLTPDIAADWVRSKLEGVFGRFIGGIAAWIITWLVKCYRILLVGMPSAYAAEDEEEDKEEDGVDYAGKEKEAWQRFKEGRHDEALEALTKTLKLLQNSKKVGGKDTPETASLHTKISKVFLAKGRLFEAWFNANIAHNTFEIIRDKDAHIVSYAEAKHDIAVIYAAQKKYKRSMDYFQASIETYERGETPDNAADVSRKLLKLYGDMAKLLVDQEEWEEASKLLRNAIEKRAGMLGEHDSEVAHAKVGLAGCIVKIKGPLCPELLDLYDDCARRFTRSYGAQKQTTRWAVKAARDLREALGLKEPGAAAGEEGDAEMQEGKEGKLG